jgi:beta-glucosidase
MTLRAEAPAGVPARLTRRPFPSDFLFGVATAAYQIEGAIHEDGRADSVWDAFARVPGAIIGGDSGETACDHYHRFAEDVAIMSDLGIGAYRFSTSWARIRPDGGPVNPLGLDFYSRLVDALLDKNIAPWLTLYHWDLPQALEDKGGWTNRDTPYLFADYARDVHGVLGDRVKSWTTLNEPWCSSFLGYLGGEHAPGRQEPEAAVAAGHHLLLGHGLAACALRELDPSLQLGITLNMTIVEPVDASDSGDVDAARRIDGQMNRFFLDPVFRGEYPADLVSDLAGLGLERSVADGDMEVISTPIDMFGVNYYHGETVSCHPAPAPMTNAAPTARPTRSPFPAAEGVSFYPSGLPRTAMGWEVRPDGLTQILRRLRDEYAGPTVKIFVTENGAAFDDRVSPDGEVHDVERTEYLRDHLGAILDAVDEGVDVGGYFYWSLMDNFEWNWGFDKRFGLVRVDYDTQVRTLKDSAGEYRRVMGGRAL